MCRAIRSPPIRCCGSALPGRRARRPGQRSNRSGRLADHTGVVSVCGQRVGIGRVYARRTLTVLVSDTTLAIELGDGDTVTL